MSLGIIVYDITNKRLFNKIYRIMNSYPMQGEYKNQYLKSKKTTKGSLN